MLDWNSWSAARRSWVVERASAVGAPIILHRLTTSLDVANDRVRRRAEDGTRFSHHVTLGGNVHLATPMEEPSPEEGFGICVH